MHNKELIELILAIVSIFVIGYTIGSYRGFKKAHKNFEKLRAGYEEVIGNYRSAL